MEVLNDDKTTSVKSGEKVPMGSGVYLFVGILMVVCGLVWLGSNYGVIGPRALDVIFSWQMMVTAVGVWLLCAKSWTMGGVVTVAGVVLSIVDYLNIYISFERLVLPLLLVAAGVAIIVMKGFGKA